MLWLIFLLVQEEVKVNFLFSFIVLVPGTYQVFNKCLLVKEQNNKHCFHVLIY